MKSNPLSIIRNSLNCPLIARNPDAPDPTGSVTTKFGGLITSNPFPGEATSIFSILPV